MVSLARFLKPEECGQTVLPDMSMGKIDEIQKLKNQIRHFGWFSNTVKLLMAF